MALWLAVQEVPLNILHRMCEQCFAGAICVDSAAHREGLKMVTLSRQRKGRGNCMTVGLYHGSCAGLTGGVRCCTTQQTRVAVALSRFSRKALLLKVLGAVIPFRPAQFIHLGVLIISPYFDGGSILLGRRSLNASRSRPTAVG